MYVTQTAWLKDDIANVMDGIAQALGGQGDEKYRQGFYAALAAMATALGIHVEAVEVEQNRTKGWDRY